MYTGDGCTNCGRVRVEMIDGRRICEKCKWNQDSNEYDDYADVISGDEPRNEYGL